MFQEEALKKPSAASTTNLQYRMVSRCNDYELKSAKTKKAEPLYGLFTLAEGNIGRVCMGRPKNKGTKMTILPCPPITDICLKFPEGLADFFGPVSCK